MVPSYAAAELSGRVAQCIRHTPRAGYTIKSPTPDAIRAAGVGQSRKPAGEGSRLFSAGGTPEKSVLRFRVNTLASEVNATAPVCGQGLPATALPRLRARIRGFACGESIIVLLESLVRSSS
jgi:hypothetical protein